QDRPVVRARPRRRGAAAAGRVPARVSAMGPPAGASRETAQAMSGMPFTLTQPCRHQEDIKKSRFLALAAPVESPGQALAFVQDASDPAATHNCWAYRIGQDYRFNDDGEPGGTAGRPILQAIEGQ